MHDEQYPPFPGLTAEGVQFLKDLRENNDRAWFKPRKQVFDEEVLDPLRCLVADFSRQAAHERLPLSGDPRHSIFRIYRDTRFSSNKQPYKTHVGMVFSRSGGRGETGVVYLHVEPGQSFVGAGFWRPETAFLRQWRLQIAAEPEAWLELTEALAAKNLRVSADDPLKRMPRGFEDLADHPVAPWLRGRSFVISRPFADDLLLRPDLTRLVLETAHDVMPLLEFGWQIEDSQSA